MILTVADIEGHWRTGGEVGLETGQGEDGPDTSDGRSRLSAGRWKGVQKVLSLST